MDSKHDPSRYPCEFCGKDFATGRGLDVHMIQKHRKKHKGQELMCSQCDYKVIGQPSKLEVHIEMKHNSLRFPCVHCELVFVNSHRVDILSKKEYRQPPNKYSVLRADLCRLFAVRWLSLFAISVRNRSLGPLMSTVSPRSTTNLISLST